MFTEDDAKHGSFELVSFAQQEMALSRLHWCHGEGVEAAPQLLDKSSPPGFSSHCWESLGKFSLDCWFFPWTELVRSIVLGGGQGLASENL